MMNGTECCVCKRLYTKKMLVQVIDSGSGPGWGLYACQDPCAVEYAKRPYAPAWLQEDLAKLGLWSSEE